MKLFSLLLVVAVASVSGFSVIPPSSRAVASSSFARSMFATDNNENKGLETVESSSDADALSNLSTTQTPRNVVKDMNTGEIKEVKWVDPAMEANTRPWEMNWWAYPLTLFPFVLLLDDAFHFLPHNK
ncbi:hypothetical protein MPSEU_000236600 [Mayamaea pseudoterrestris]|nr:hypothetical protein MPSEU_000236600 [Mayamaea pseudoterrestris]